MVAFPSIGIAGIINSALSSAGGGVGTGTLHKRTAGTRGTDPTAGVQPSFTDYSFNGFVDVRGEKRIGDTLVSQGGQTLVILGGSLQAGIEPEQGDEATVTVDLNGTSVTKRYTIIGIPIVDPANATYECSIKI